MRGTLRVGLTGGDARTRKDTPISRGFLEYFPDVVVAVAQLSHIGNQQHHPDEPVHWDKAKSTDEGDAMLRHYMDHLESTRDGGDGLDTDGVPHVVKVAWRAMALCQRWFDACSRIDGSDVSSDPLVDDVVEPGWHDDIFIHYSDCNAHMGEWCPCYNLAYAAGHEAC
jgi:hypothetical protein